uniref:Uncharacterized protein n=1 Tax=Tanacetum cinerariifolium TaxID=118510 RepID=A0A6L2K1J9_TANCI|nr:hypothetical protein [Tanacetum cinerariifolium]
MKANAKTEDPHEDVGKLEKDGDKAMHDQNANAKTEDPNEDVRKLEKDWDKAMNDHNARRLRMHLYPSKPKAMKIGWRFLQFQFSSVLTTP